MEKFEFRNPKSEILVGASAVNASSTVLTLFLILAIAVWGNFSPASAEQSKLLGTFSLTEAFGVSHPKQIVDFDFPQKIDLRSTYMIGPAGNEVAYQALHDERIAIETDLPANAQRTWKLYTGKSPAALKAGVRITSTKAYYEITNELTGVRVPVATKTPKESTPGPIQGVRARDGEWTALGPNSLSISAKNLSVRFLERGPLKVVLEVSYTFDRREYFHKGRGAPPEGIRYPAGEGYYRSTIELQAGQPSIMVEEETDMDVSYRLNVYNALRPDRARYRGHHATSKTTGYEVDGKQYRPWHERPAMDAFVDLDYDAPKNYRRMAVWDPWIFDSGWYWMLYDSKAPGTANLFGIFAGRTSRAIGAANSGVSVYTADSTDKEHRIAGFNISCNRGSPDGRYFPRVRFSWGLFAGVKSEDLRDPNEIQPIARQMNLHAALNLNKIHRYKLTFPDPKRGYGALYMDSEALGRKIATLRRDNKGPHGDGFYGYLYKAEPTSRNLIDMWADRFGKKAKDTVNSITDTAKNLLNALVNGDGIYHFGFHYWHGGLKMMHKGVWIDAVLADGRINLEDKARVKAAAALFASILWDDDFVPLFTEHGLNLGTENMPIQQLGYRNFYALFLAEHPAMEMRAEQVAEQTGKTLHRIVNEHGAEIGSPHYVGASFTPTLNLLLQIKMLGDSDPFADQSRLTGFAKFYLNFLTPPEVRFGRLRKIVSIGDGSTESSALYGALATGFATVNPELSARLMGAWRSVGKPHSGFFGSTLLMIDEEAPFKDPALGNASFPGWYSVLRHGWGTENETALWLINGDFYRDHRHHDYGSLVLYALGAPLSIDWGSMYSPHVPGGFMHSVVLPQSSIKHLWDQDKAPLNVGEAWKESRQDAFLSFNTAAYAKASFRSRAGLVWTRSVQSIHPREDYPIIVICDHFDGTNATTSKIFSLNLMAEGEVDTPVGRLSPPLRSYGKNEKLPSAGQVFQLAPGVQRLGFTGQWLIDWDLFVLSTESQQAQIGNWAHTWHPNQEQNEFKRSNGRPFEERQHILRIKGNGPFQVLILPYRKGQKQDNLQVKQDGSKVTITAKDESTIIGENFYTYKNSQRRVLATFDDQPVGANEISTRGGPTEINIESHRVSVTAHGRKGIREIGLPGTWNIGDYNQLEFPLTFKAGKWFLDYQGETPLTVILEKPQW